MRLVLPVLALALMIYSLLDCARTPEEDMPARMPKFLWIVLIAILPPVGPIAWIIVSRVKAAEERGGYVEPTVWSSREGTTFHRPERPRPMAPDDDPDFLRSLDSDLRRRRKSRRPDGPAPEGHGPDARDTSANPTPDSPQDSSSQSPQDAEGQDDLPA